MFYQYFIKPVFFCFNPETAHAMAMRALKLLCAIPGGKLLTNKLFNYQNKTLETSAFGLNFPNPVGLAAGFDKDGKYFSVLENLGLGFIEIGTVTPRPQDGNPKPRLFRLPDDEALINRMGFNNEGLEVLKNRLKNRTGKVIIGGNIGKNKDTPNELAINDYLEGFHQLFDVVDYFVVNVSSPNTPNLRALQEKEPLTKILSQLQESNLKKPRPKAILLKIAPDLTNEQLDDIIEIVKTTRISGVIATNTTITRNNLTTNKAQIESIGNGGLSGKPVREMSTRVIRYIHEHSGGTIPVIGVGGIHTAQDAKEKLDAGACLVQVFTGFIYEGPSIVKRINKYLAKSCGDGSHSL